MRRLSCRTKQFKLLGIHEIKGCHNTLWADWYDANLPACMWMAAMLFQASPLSGSSCAVRVKACEMCHRACQGKNLARLHPKQS